MPVYIVTSSPFERSLAAKAPPYIPFHPIREIGSGEIREMLKRADQSSLGFELLPDVRMAEFEGVWMPGRIVDTRDNETLICLHHNCQASILDLK